MSSIFFIDKLKPSFVGNLIDEEDVDFPYLSNTGKLIYFDGTKFVESSLTETDEKIISSKTLEVPPGSIDVGTGQELSGGRRLLNLKNIVSNEEFIMHAIKIISTGTEPLHYPKMGSLSDITIQELKDTTSSLNFSFTYESATNRYVSGYIIESPNNVVGGKMTFRDKNASGDIVSTIEDISLTANTETFVPLVNKMLFGVGDITYVSMEGMILKGTGVGASFIPFFTSRARIYTLENIMTETNSATTIVLAEKLDDNTIRFTKRDDSTIDIDVGDMLSTNNLSDLDNVSTARTNLGVDESGTDNSTNVSLGGTSGDVTNDTLDLTGQELTVNAVTQTTDGAMLASDKLKLDNISSDLNVYYAESLSLSTTNKETYQTKVTLTDTFDAGDYFIEVNYDWSIDSYEYDFISEVTLDGTRLGNEHKQEIKERSRSQYIPVFRRYKRTLTGASHTILLKYKTSDNDACAEISSASITVTKIDTQ